ncbi:hypothetical protein HY634_01545, partial [Candidatus Uhrbacteria bacterium]|nr:hypothetical protein [Candidatus Uhrbacteria bacterium]
MRLSSRHGPVLLVSLLIAAGIMLVAFVFFVRARTVMQEEIRARLLSTVAAAALHIDGDTLDTIRGPADRERPEYRALTRYLRELTLLPDITFAYVLRPGTSAG